jgi:hypothetical protein
VIMKTIGIVVAAVALAGCTQTQTVWTKEGITPAALSQDKAQCDYDAAKAAAGTGHRGEFFSPGLQELMQEKRFASLCMEGRGYTRVAVDKTTTEQ